MNTIQNQPTSFTTSKPSIETDSPLNVREELRSDWDIENDRNSRSAIWAIHNNHFTDDRRIYSELAEDRYGDQIHICDCCGTEWTALDVKDSNGHFVAGWIWNPSLKRSMPICHSCREKNSTLAVKPVQELKPSYRKAKKAAKEAFKAKIDAWKSEQESQIFSESEI